MNRSRLLAFIALLGACTNSDSPGADSSSSGVPVGESAAGNGTALAAGCTTQRITGDSIGPLRIGMPVDSVPLVCPVQRDTTVRGVEGQMSRVLNVLVGNDTVFAEIADARVWRLLVRSQGLFTADSLSVGSSVLDLVALPSPNPMVGEGYLYVATPAHCGMSFRLSVPPSTLTKGEWTTAELRKLDLSVHVTRILIFGCKQPPR